MNQEPEGVSSRSLLGAFFAVVVLCAVFFSLGFFLGNRQGHPGSALATEQVPAASDIPPDVNAPDSSQPIASAEPRGTSAGSPSAAASQPAESDASPEQSGTAASRSPTTEAADGPAGNGAKPGTAPEDGEPLDSIVGSRVPSGVLVQVAAVTNRQDAANVVGVLKSRNYPALILTPAQAKARDSYYRVVAGPYKSRTDAERVRKELTAEGFKPFIR